jgi:hypothetical protein
VLAQLVDQVGVVEGDVGLVAIWALEIWSFSTLSMNSEKVSALVLPLETVLSMFQSMMRITTDMSQKMMPFGAFALILFIVPFYPFVLSHYNTSAGISKNARPRAVL